MLHIESRGRGDRVIVLGGGPGFSYRYLVAGLAPLEQEFELLYVEYPGCGRSRDANDAPSFPALVDAVIETLIDHGKPGPAHLLCHSFGVTVLGAALAAKAAIAIDRCLFANPAPPTRSGCDRVERIFLSRMSQEDIALFGEMLAGGRRPANLVQRLLPYYCGRDHDLPTVDLEFYPDAYAAIVGTAGEFDFTEALAVVRERLYLFGSTDFISPDLFEGVLGGPGVRSQILDGGHFLPLDASLAFCRTATAFFRESATYCGR